jgi:outer membrane lipoprotein carrier protein
MWTSALLFCLTSTSPQAASLLQKLQKTYHTQTDMSAQFTQSYTDKLRQKTRQEKGTLWVKSDGRLRWSYRTPVIKDFIYDGQTAYFYEPSSAQVTLFDRFEDSPLSQALRFVWGQGDLSGTFDAGLCEHNCPPKTPGVEVLTLLPKQALPAVERLQLVIDSNNGQVRQSIVFDPIGNVTRYTFEDVRFGQSLPTSKFVFKIPDGVSILHTGAESAR